jgi:hypothetical protein
MASRMPRKAAPTVSAEVMRATSSTRVATACKYPEDHQCGRLKIHCSGIRRPDTGSIWSTAAERVLCPARSMTCDAVSKREITGVAVTDGFEVVVDTVEAVAEDLTVASEDARPRSRVLKVQVAGTDDVTEPCLYPHPGQQPVKLSGQPASPTIQSRVQAAVIRQRPRMDEQVADTRMPQPRRQGVNLGLPTAPVHPRVPHPQGIVTGTTRRRRYRTGVPGRQRDPRRRQQDHRHTQQGDDGNHDRSSP